MDDYHMLGSACSSIQHSFTDFNNGVSAPNYVRFMCVAITVSSLQLELKVSNYGSRMDEFDSSHSNVDGIKDRFKDRWKECAVPVVEIVISETATKINDTDVAKLVGKGNQITAQLSFVRFSDMKVQALLDYGLRSLYQIDNSHFSEFRTQSGSSNKRK
jgi:hypothetical protein